MVKPTLQAAIRRTLRPLVAEDVIQSVIALINAATPDGSDFNRHIDRDQILAVRAN